MADANDPGPRRASPGGPRVSHYEILELIGEGGMGVVYRARDLTLPREAALKRPRPADDADPDRQRRFLREGRSTAALSHPGIVRIYEVFEEDGVPWIAMEYVRGQTLRAAIQDSGPLPWDRVIHISEELVLALQAAHAGRVLHRDIKPGNVILGEDGRARLVDFGLARVFVRPEEASSATTQSSDISKRGSVVGTTAYMSPEQALGKSLDERSDIFSLGSVLYEMCTARATFPGADRARLLDAILHQDPVAIGRLNYAIPEDFERIVRKCLAKDREDRYPDTRDLLVDIRKLRRESESGVTAGTDAPRRPAALRRMKTAIGIGLLALVALAAALAGGVRWSSWSNPPRDDARAYYDRGVRYLEERENEQQLREAIGLLTRAVEEDPGFAPAHAALGTAYWERYRLSGEAVFREEADRAVTEAMRLAPDLAETRNAKGYGFLVQGSYGEAKKAFLEAIEADPNQARAWANLGQACADLGEYEEGLEALRRAIDLRPDHVRYQIRIGTFFDRFSEHAAAKKAYLKAIELKPGSWIAWSNLGAVQLKTGEIDEAVRSLERAAGIEETADVRSNLGTAFYFLGRLEEAIPEYRRAVALEPAKAVYWANLGDVLRETGREAEAREAYRSAIPLAREAVEREPGNPRVHARLGMYCARAGEISCALQEAERLAAMEPPDADLSLSEAIIYCLAGRAAESLDALERAARLGIRKSQIEKDPDLARLGDEPRYQRILKLAG